MDEWIKNGERPEWMNDLGFRMVRVYGGDLVEYLWMEDAAEGRISIFELVICSWLRNIRQLGLWLW